MRTTRLAVQFALVASLMLCAPADADIVFSFYGTCGDCTLNSPPVPPFGSSFVASLTVNDGYLSGTGLSPANFVSFTYGGSNLIPGFTYSAGDPPGLPVDLDGVLLFPALPSDGTPVPVITPTVPFFVTFPGGCTPLLGVQVGSPPCLSPDLVFFADLTSWRMTSGVPGDRGNLSPNLLAARVVPTPGPATLVLLGGGLAATLAWRRRR